MHTQMQTPHLITVLLKAGLIWPTITLLRDQWQANNSMALQKTKPVKGQPGKDSEELEI